MSFREYICWRDDAVIATTPRDAASLGDGHFQAIHHPLRLRRRRLDDRSDGRWVTELQIIEALRGPVRPDGYLFIPIVGGAGTGKSHLVRWVKDRTKEVEAWESRYLPKNRTGIRRAIEIVIRGLSGKKIDEAREALEAAPAQTEADDVLAERLLDELALLVARTDELPADPSVQLGERQVQLRRKLERQLPDVLRDPVVRRKLVEPGAVIHRLVGLTVRGRQEGDGLDDDATRFLDSDLPLTFDEIGDTSRGARTLLGQLATIPDLLTSAIVLINEALPLAEKRVSVSGAIDLVEIFRDVRRALREQGKELVLFIEDLTVLHGVEREFLDAIVEPARSPEGDMCNLRVIFAVTEGHFDDLDTVKTRCDDAYWLDAPYGEGGVELDEALSFLGRYLNSSRLDPDHVEESWASRHSPGWLPNACTPCSYRDECHDTFGRSSEGYGLYPLNSAAAGRFVEALSAERFDPRDVVREVINRFLLQGAADMRQRPPVFPSDAALSTFDRNAEPLPPLLAAEVHNLRPTDHERVVNTLRYWSDDDSHVSVKDATLDAFGIDPRDLGLDALRSLAGERTPVERPQKAKDRPETRSGVEARLSGSWRAVFAELTQWPGTRDLSAAATREMRKLVHKTILGNLELGSTPVHIGVEFSTRFRAEPHIAIEGTVTQQNLDAAIVVVARTETNAAALQGLILANELRAHDYPQANYYRRLVASKIETWTAEVAGWLTGPPPSSVVSVVEALVVASTLVGLATRSREPADFLDAIFQPLPDATADALPRSERWTTLTAQARALIPRLRSTVEAEFGESRGTRGNVRAIQADRLLPIIDAFTKTWKLDSPDPAIAPLMRNVAAAVDEEWALLTTRVANVGPQVDRDRPWPDQTAKVLEALRLAHNAGRLRDVTALDELTTLAAQDPERALRSYFEATELTAKERSLPERIVALAGVIPARVALVHAFATRASSAIAGVETDLLERQAASGTTDMESIADQVLTATARFADLAKELAG